MSDVCTACLRRICVCPCRCQTCTPPEPWRRVTFLQPPPLPAHEDLEETDQ